MNMYGVQPGYQGPTLGGYLNNRLSDVVIDWPVYCGPSLGEYCREPKITLLSAKVSFIFVVFMNNCIVFLLEKGWANAL